MSKHRRRPGRGETPQQSAPEAPPSYGEGWSGTSWSDTSWPGDDSRYAPRYDSRYGPGYGPGYAAASEPEPMTRPDAGDGADWEHDLDARPRSRKRHLKWALPVAALLAAVPVGVYAAYASLNGNITHVGAVDLGPRPAKLTKSQNILVIGSDSRAGANSAYGSEQGARTDTMVLFHVPANGANAQGVSLPRDSMVSIPSCKTPNGTTIPAHTGQINAAFNEGGLGCAWKTTESVTGVHVDHVLQIDFTGFKGMVDALGGVELTVPQAIHDPKAHLNLKAGRQKLNGEQALGYARTRYTVGDGSDLGRIKRQQQLMKAMADTAKQKYGDPTKAWSFLRAATKSVTTDQGLGLKGMFDLGMSVGDTAAVKFATVPVEAYPADKNRVQWTEPAANRLFATLR